MSRRAWTLAGLAILLIAVPFLLLTRRSYRDSQRQGDAARVLRFSGQDYGYPTPFQFYPRGPGYLLMSLVFDTLVWKDHAGLVGLLAESWTCSEDGTEYRLTLRPGVRWHDGTACTGEDVAFSYRYYLAHPFTWTDMSAIEEVTAIDAWQVRIRLKRPMPAFLTDVAGTVPILPAHIWRAIDDPRAFTGERAVIGTGPFRLRHYSKTHGTYTFSANTHYFLGRPRVDELQYIAVADPVLALRQEEIDGLMLQAQSAEAFDVFKDDPRFRVIRGPGDWVLRLVFNHKHPLFAQRTVRQAIAQALDLHEIAHRIRHDHVDAGNPGFLPASSPWAHPDLPPYAFNPQAARALLQGIDLPRTPVSLLTVADHIREAEYLRGQLALLGIPVTIKTLPGPTRDALLREGKFDLALDGHGGLGGDADLLRRNFCDPARGLPGTAYGYHDEEFARLARQQRHETDPKRRRALVDRLQELIARDVPTIALWYPHLHFVYRPSALDGWYFTPGGIAQGIPLAENKLIYLERNTPTP